MSDKIKAVLSNQPENHILPFFWQHGEDEETLRTYMRVIDEANIGAVCVESRPHPDYCGPKWWEDMDVILDEARRRGMKVWILDDSHFPTGFANGAMENEPKEKARRSVCCQMYPMEGGQTVSFSAEELKHPAEAELSELEKQIGKMMGKSGEIIPQSEFEDDALIAVSALSADGQRIDLKKEVTEEGLSFTLPEGSWKVYKINTTRNRGAHQNYINMIDKASCRVLIDAVYEPHWSHYSADFGKTIAGFFSDEPELGNGHLYDLHHELGIGFGMDYPWSRELEEALKTSMGEELPFMLPLIWETEGDESLRAKARYTYMDNLTQLLAKNFSRQIGDWCREHGVQYIGHMIEDNGQHCRTGSTLGHYFRGLAGQDMAGIDDIGGQVYPQGEDDSYELMTLMVRDGEFYHFMLGKLANSLAAIDPAKHQNAMCEIFGNYGWEEGVVLEKYLADHFLVRGITHYVPHAFTPKAFPDRDCPPHFYAHGHNPQYRHFGTLMTYMNRAATLLSGGRHTAPVAVLYHGEAEWTGACMPDQKPARVLTEMQTGFDFLPQDVFANPAYFCTKIENGVLAVNTQRYRMLVVPKAQFVTKAFAAAVPKLLAAGVPVIFLEARPEGICDEKDPATEQMLCEGMTAAACIPLEGLGDAVRKAGVSEIVLDAPNAMLREYHYIHEDGSEVWMLVNEGTEVYRGSFTLSGRDPKESAFWYDAYAGTVHPILREEGCIDLTLVPNRSRFLLLPRQDSELTALCEDLCGPELQAEGAPVPFTSEAWTRTTCKSIDYPAFAEPKAVTLPDALHEEQELFSGYVRYENTFEAAADDRLVLTISEAWEGVEVFLNGESLGIQITKPYLYDLIGKVKDGENTLRIEVASTLEREMSTIPDPFGRPKEIKGFLGITGEVSLIRK